jgi:hypothetical protein
MTFNTQRDSSHVRLPVLALEHHHFGEDIRTRVGTLAEKKWQDSERQDAVKELRKACSADRKSLLYQDIADRADKARMFEDELRRTFVPLHTPDQFLGARILFVSPLFGVRSTKEAREPRVHLQLPVPSGTSAIRYEGPELRQSDGLVFLALLHMLRDFRTGAVVSLPPEAVCLALYGRYDGNARRQLREHIQRLQQGLLIFKTFSVQLCQTFEYPKTGPWSVALDRHIVELFFLSQAVWLPLTKRLSLPEGMATWLFTFISSQTRLIPMRLATLRSLCGSHANDKAFANRTRGALKLLALDLTHLHGQFELFHGSS